MTCRRPRTSLRDFYSPTLPLGLPRPSLARRTYTYCFVEVVARTASRNATQAMTLTELFDGVVMTFWDRLRRYLSQLRRALTSF